MADTAKRTTRTFETLTQIGVIVLVIAGVSGLGVLNHAKDEAMRTRLADAVPRWLQARLHQPHVDL